jgi:ornithine cyclodeaminase
MRVIGWDEVHRLMDYRAVTDAILAMYRKGCDAMDRVLLEASDGQGTPSDSLVQPAWIKGLCLGIKVANIFPGNEARGLPTIVGGVLLFDADTGAPVAFVDGAAETLVKTACNSAVATRLLARKDAATLAMFGAGKLAPHLVRAHAAERPIRRVIVWNRTAERGERLAETLRSEGMDASAERDPAKAAGEADIVSCATFAGAPILRGAWLKPGVHVDLVGSYRPDQREADDDVVRRGGRLYVDARFSTVGVSGDAIGPMEAGIIGEAGVTDLFELAQGRKPGRRSDADITVFKSGGGGHEDLAAAWRLYEMATAHTA